MKRCNTGGFCLRPHCAVAFGLGLILSCFCPTGLMLFIVAIVMVWLGLALIRRC